MWIFNTFNSAFTLIQIQLQKLSPPATLPQLKERNFEKVTPKRSWEEWEQAKNIKEIFVRWKMEGRIAVND